MTNPGKTSAAWMGWLVGLLIASCLAGNSAAANRPKAAPFRKTAVTIVGDQFYINGKPTYQGRNWNGHRIEGLLLNSRMVQGIFEDRNAQTAKRWAYPDTKKFDAERNTREFIAAMPEWRRHGLLAFTINLQGGSPEGYSKAQPWHNSAIEEDGSLRPDYMSRLERILNRADELGMAVILGYFYFGQDERLKDENAVLRAADNATQWILERGYRHVLVEINNECNVRYDHAILKPDRVHELITRVKDTSLNNRRLYVATSYGGGTIPEEKVVRASDFILIHGNGVSDPNRIAEMVRKTRQIPGYFTKPILFNEDDHFNFDQPKNNFVAALSEYASWGYFDPGTNNYWDGYQSPPVNWGINTERKRQFFGLLSAITGSGAPAVRATAPPQVAPPKTEKRTPAPSRPRPEREERKIVSSSGGRSGPKFSIRETQYQGWAGSYIINNGTAEVVVVPAIGRVMQFGFAGEPGVFWENSSLFGKPANAQAEEWVNFGGDKTWPSPEADWGKFTKRSTWRPPAAFDSMPVSARVEGQELILTSPVDPSYGVRTIRRVQLDSAKPVLKVVTTYERVIGEPADIGIWIITQLKEPVALYAPRAPSSSLTNGYVLLIKEPPPSLKVTKDTLHLARNPKSSHKIGLDADSLLWVGENAMLRIDSPRVKEGKYPDGGSSAEIYTNPDPLKYIELETLGTLSKLGPGDRISQTNTYTLMRRTSAEPKADARMALGLSAN